MKEVVLITGANGLIAKRLSEKLKESYSVRLLTRKKRQENEFEWDIDKGKIDYNALVGVNHIIHLAGANIAGKRWTEKRKKEIICSRVDSAKLLLYTLKKNKIKIDTFISASAVGFYGTSTTENIYLETDPKGRDYLSDVVNKWEQIADIFIKEGVAQRVIKIRTGVVLSQDGGALTKMLLPIKYYFGAILGSGKQYMPWIHIEDLCSIYEYSLQNKDINGVYNACSPTHTTNKEFTKLLAKIIQKPIISPNIPSFIIKLIFGKSSVIILKGSRVNSKKIKDEGFNFKFPHLKSALENLLK